MPNPEAFAADAIFAKTALGQAEIQQRTLRLPPLLRRVLLLVDAKRTVADLAAFAGNADVAMLIAELTAKGCVERVAAPPVAVPGPSGASLGLPPPETRSKEQVEMARHFMINTVNRMLEQNTRLTLVEKIAHSRDAAELRSHFSDWEVAISSSWIAARRLPELRKKLFAVL